MAEDRERNSHYSNSLIVIPSEQSIHEYNVREAPPSPDVLHIEVQELHAENQNEQHEQNVIAAESNPEAMQVEQVSESVHNQIIVQQTYASSDISTAKKAKLESNEEEKVTNISLDNTISEDQKCSICLDMWSNYGEHRLCSLKCGHLFGLSCIKKWLEPLRIVDRRCPECNTKAHKKDIRVLYAKKLVATDTAELEKVKEELRISEEKRMNYEKLIKNMEIQQEAYQSQISTLQMRIINLEKNLANQNAKASFLKNVHNIDICSRGGCRVMAYSSWHRTLITSMMAPNPRVNYEDHGFCKVMLDTMSSSPFIHAHNKSVRDMMFSHADPNICLSVGFDEQIVLFDIRSCAVMHKYREPNAMFWSCCWSRENGNHFHAGTQSGHILKYDLRHLGSAVETVKNENDRSPIVSLAAVSSFPSPYYGVSGFIACHLNSCYAYIQHASMIMSECLDIKGPFMSVRFDEESKHALFSCRSNPSRSGVRHLVCLVSKSGENQMVCETIHAFNGGTTQQRLSRPCHMYLPNDTLIAASNESTNCVQLWSMSTGKEVYKQPVSEPVIDTCSFHINDVYLALLTPHKVSIYKHEMPSPNL